MDGNSDDSKKIKDKDKYLKTNSYFRIENIIYSSVIIFFISIMIKEIIKLTFIENKVEYENLKLNLYKNLYDLLLGAILECAFILLVGQPLEVWKTRVSYNNDETNLSSLYNIYARNGIISFYEGLGPKIIESILKGGILLWAKELILNLSYSLEISPFISGFLAGAGGGVAQSLVCAPASFIITAFVTSKDKNISVTSIVKDTYNKGGISGFYTGISAVAGRGASNWAIRQAVVELMRDYLIFYRNTTKLTIWDEVYCGIIAGSISVLNQPFEVCRIKMQANYNKGNEEKSFLETITEIWNNEGLAGLYRGVIPRGLFAIWQTLFMITAKKVLDSKK